MFVLEFAVAALWFVFVLIVVLLTGIFLLANAVVGVISDLSSMIFDYIDAGLKWLDDIDWISAFATVITTVFVIVLSPLLLIKILYTTLIDSVYDFSQLVLKLVGGNKVSESDDITLPERNTVDVVSIYINGKPVKIYRYYYDSTCVVKEFIEPPLHSFLLPISGRGKTFAQAEYAFVLEYRNSDRTS